MFCMVADFCRWGRIYTLLPDAVAGAKEEQRITMQRWVKFSAEMLLWTLRCSRRHRNTQNTLTSFVRMIALDRRVETTIKSYWICINARLKMPGPMLSQPFNWWYIIIKLQRAGMLNSEYWCMALNVSWDAFLLNCGSTNQMPCIQREGNTDKDNCVELEKCKTLLLKC